ncbi:MAG: hypothetical protein COB26_11665 [Piscirickettsiaceae bacterium]|nr:MAG: hypothetical protein COB26_11665 [Piscirickettsiaceae bacterium]
MRLLLLAKVTRGIVMPLAAQVEKQFKTHKVAHKVINLKSTMTLEEIANKNSNDQQVVLRTLIITSDKKTVLIVVPVHELIDFSALKDVSNQQIDIIPLERCKVFYPSCDDGIVPPISTHQFSHTFIASSIKQFEHVIFESGKKNGLVHMSVTEFLKLHPTATVDDITAPTSNISITDIDKDESKRLKQRFTPDSEKKNSLQRLYKLPPLPDIATRIIQLKNNPNADAKALASVIEKDPSLTAQVIRYAKSAFFNYQGDINSVHEAISRVLGFDLVMNMALGLSAGKTLRNPPDGPLGLNEFWRHAVYSAGLAQRLSLKIPAELRPNSNLAYLAGLLHNFGFLLLGHLFQPEFFLLNKLYGANLKSSIVSIEKHALGMGAGQNAINMGHAELGSWLLDNWKISDEVIVATREHHNHNYTGEHSNYAALIGLVDSALGLNGIGDNRTEILNEGLCDKLKLDPVIVTVELERIMAEQEQIDSIAKQFAA